MGNSGNTNAERNAGNAWNVRNAAYANFARNNANARNKGTPGISECSVLRNVLGIPINVCAGNAGNCACWECKE